MKLIEKIQRVRLDLQRANLKMTGRNRTFEYFELEDFLPTLNKLMFENKMTAIATFESDLAILTAYDFESEEVIQISSPMGTAKLAGCHEVQNIGAVETYQRRYLYQTMFDINAKDMVDSSFEKEDKLSKLESKQSLKVTCDKCGAEIKGIKSKGKAYTPQQAKESLQGLCVDCYKEEIKQKEQTEIKEVEVINE